jgi:hypothetical protein
MQLAPKPTPDTDSLLRKCHLSHRFYLNNSASALAVNKGAQVAQIQARGLLIGVHSHLSAYVDGVKSAPQVSRAESALAVSKGAHGADSKEGLARRRVHKTSSHSEEDEASTVVLPRGAGVGD